MAEIVVTVNSFLTSRTSRTFDIIQNSFLLPGFSGLFVAIGTGLDAVSYIDEDCVVD